MSEQYISSPYIRSIASITTESFSSKKPFTKKQKGISKSLEDPKLLFDKTIHIINALDEWEAGRQSWTHSIHRQKFYESMYYVTDHLLTPRAKTKIACPYQLRFSNLSNISSKDSEISTMAFSQKSRLSRGKNVNRHRYQSSGSWQQKRIRDCAKVGIQLLSNYSFGPLKRHIIEGELYFQASSMIEGIALMVFDLSSKYISSLYQHFRWSFLASELGWLNDNMTIPLNLSKIQIDSLKLIFVQYLDRLRIQSTNSILESFEVSAVAHIAFRQGMIDSKVGRQQILKNFKYTPQIQTIIQYLKEQCGFQVQFAKDKFLIKATLENHQFIVRKQGYKVYYKINF